MFFIHNRQTVGLDGDNSLALFKSHGLAAHVARALRDAHHDGWEVGEVETIVVDDVLAQIDAQADAELQVWLDSLINH